MSDNFTVGTHGERIADSQPRGRIWGFNTTSVVAQNPPLRPALFAGPQQFDIGYGRVYHRQIPGATALIPGARFVYGNHQHTLGEFPYGCIAKHPHISVQSPEQHFLGGYFRIEQDNPEQPFARTWRVAALPSIAPSPPPLRPILFAGPEQTNLEPHARLFRVTTLPSAAFPPFRLVAGGPQQTNLEPHARLFRAAEIASAVSPDTAQIYIAPQFEQQMPSFICGTQPRDSDIAPVPGTLLCRAYRRGFFGGKVIEPGESVTITGPEQYSPYWLEVIGALPTNWDTVMRRFVRAIDREELRAVTVSEVGVWLDTSREPPDEPPSGVFD